MLFINACSSPSSTVKTSTSRAEASPIAMSPPLSASPRSVSSTSVRASSDAAHSSPRPSLQAGILTAAEIDDNLNFTAFKKYLKNSLKDSLKQLPRVTQGTRVHIKVVDATGRGVSNAQLMIEGQRYYTRSDGHFYFYPSYELPRRSANKSFSMTLMQKNQVIKKTTVTVQKGMQKIEMPRVQNRLPTTLDLMFVIDTTGSMGDELRYITTELKSIIKRVKHLHPATAIRYGLVVYRDKGDQYVVQSYPFQNSLSKMEALLSQQSANGGGDYPEAMDAAMKRAMKADWKTGNTARMLFLIADAPPHDNTISQTLKSAHLAHQKGIRIYPVGASGVADKAEYVMRHMALISNGRYLFLTDDSGVGNKHQEPHVACYVVTRLDQLMSRVISAELAGRRVEPSQAEVKRKVGDYDNGVCHLTQTVQQTN
jgi:Mg-chelatase subunit ChlD